MRFNTPQKSVKLIKQRKKGLKLKGNFANLNIEIMGLRKRPYTEEKKGGRDDSRQKPFSEKRGPAKPRSFGDAKPTSRVKRDEFSSNKGAYSSKTSNRGPREDRPNNVEGRRPGRPSASSSFDPKRKTFGAKKEYGSKSREGDSTNKRAPYGRSKDDGANPKRPSYGRSRDEGSGNFENRRPTRSARPNEFDNKRKTFGEKKEYGKSREEGVAPRRPSYGKDREVRDFKSNRGFDEKPKRFGNKTEGGEAPRRSTPYRQNSETARPSRYDGNRPRVGKTGRPYMVKGAKARDTKAKSEEMLETLTPDIVRLNRYISNAGICSRREADNLIGAGLVSVNGEVITEMGYKVKPGDEVRYNKERLSWEKKVYLLMNKPKDTITTSDDPEGRKIIMDLIKDPRLPRVYPVGRLDRNTTGAIVLTNDGELAQRLTHPKYNINKVYKAVLNKNFAPKDMQELGTNGVELEDGPIKPDALGIPSVSEKNVVLIQIHSGRNHIIHRMFEAMGYLVDKLDRIDFAGLEKSGLGKGEWRHLDEKEIKKLKKLVQLK